MNLNKDPDSWRRVSVDAVISGSRAQGENVLRMAIEDILRLDAECQSLRATQEQAIRDRDAAWRRLDKLKT